MPNVNLIVFDMGLSMPAARLISEWATVRHFNSFSWAPHCGLGPNVNAWKAILVWTLAREAPQETIVWTNATTVWRPSTFAQIETAVSRYGMCVTDSGAGPLRHGLAKTTAEAFLRAPYNIDPLKAETLLDLPLVSTKCVAFDASRPIVRRILTMWLQYAVNVDLIAPANARTLSGGAHAYDAAGLSYFLHLYAPDVLQKTHYVQTSRNVDEPTFFSVLSEAVQETVQDGTLAAAFVSSLVFAGFLVFMRPKRPT